MKKILFIVSILLASISYSTGPKTDYCRGFAEGFKEGYCYRDYGCIAPVTPPCPIPEMDEQNTYKGGYNRGFDEGRKKKKKDQD